LFQPLDWELYALNQGPVTDDEILSTALTIDQTGEIEALNCVKSVPNLRSIAVIDRTADVKKAAQQILAAHVAFSGHSPHAPDLIVVNEWVKNKFLEEIILERTSATGREVHSSHAGDDKHAAWKTALVEAESNGEATLIKKEGLYMIDVHQR
jgi:hypothetical protein